MTTGEQPYAIEGYFFNRRFTQHVVANWLGHSESIAVKHYLRTKDEHFRQATQLMDDATQIPTQQVTATDGTEQKPGLKDSGFDGELRLDAVTCRSVLREEVPPQGLEP